VPCETRWAETISKAVWVGVPRVIEFVARREASRVVIDGAPPETLRYRWSFETITGERDRKKV
jgi:hypothetical protein